MESVVRQVFFEQPMNDTDQAVRYHSDEEVQLNSYDKRSDNIRHSDAAQVEAFLVNGSRTKSTRPVIEIDIAARQAVDGEIEPVECDGPGYPAQLRLATTTAAHQAR